MLFFARVEKLSKNKGVSMAQISIAWMLSKDVVAAPVISTTSLDNLYDIVGGLDVSLTSDEVKYLEEAYRPMPILGHT